MRYSTPNKNPAASASTIASATKYTSTPAGFAKSITSSSGVVTAPYVSTA
jgi:hypothetical protein